MSPVRRGTKNDAPAIAQRVVEQLARDAKLEPLVCERFSRQEFEYALANSTSTLWVDDANGQLRGHLYGITLDGVLDGLQTWSGPDGYSYDFSNVLDNLCEWAYNGWREQGSRAHLVWALAGSGTQEWVDRGYHFVSVRGSLALGEKFEVTWPPTGRLRRADSDDLPTALMFDHYIDEAQGLDVESLTPEQILSNQSDLIDVLDDPDSHYFIVDVEGRPAAQCVTFALPPLRGNFPHTIHLGSLAVAPDFRRHALATTLVHHTLNEAFDAGYRHAEVRWHIDNEAATSFWSSLGFRPTYVLLRRPLSV